MKSFTIGEFLDAVEKNGYKKIRGQFIERKLDGQVGAACAFGQAALNLDVDPTRLCWAVEIVSPFLKEDIVRMNDHTNISVRTIGRRMREKYEGRLMETITVQDV